MDLYFKWAQIPWRTTQLFQTITSDPSDLNSTSLSNGTPHKTFKRDLKSRRSEGTKTVKVLRMRQNIPFEFMIRVRHLKVYNTEAQSFWTLSINNAGSSQSFDHNRSASSILWSFDLDFREADYSIVAWSAFESEITVFETWKPRRRVLFWGILLLLKQQKSHEQLRRT